MSTAETLPMPTPSLSVVVGSINARHSVGPCLDELLRQRNGRGIEIIVADNSADGTAEIVGRRFPDVKLLRCDDDMLMPQLWEAGIRQSSGEVVALTTSHFVPARDWVEKILEAHINPASGIGGAIENDPAGGIVSWAVYFCRYSPYMLPFEGRAVNDFAGDNASYKRSALERCVESRRDGFWESFVHAELRAEGLPLALVPDVVVFHQKSFTLVGFMTQRFWHGRQYGSKRVSNLPVLRRLLYAAMAPGIPAISLLRITRRVLSRKRNLGRYILSLPALMLFILSWSGGEFSGYLWPSVDAK